METVKAECRSCGGTGVYCGFCEHPGVGVLCVTCGGTGCETIRYTPFTGIKRKRGVKTISVSQGLFLATGVGAKPGTSVNYNKWFKAVK